MKTCCNSKCPVCWFLEDSKNLYTNKLHNNIKLYAQGKINKETYEHNREHIVKYDNYV